MKEVQTEIINTTERISQFVDWLDKHHASSTPRPKPTMYLDLEGVKLSRNGSISILIILIDTGSPKVHVFLVDVHVLGSQAFNTAGDRSKTLKDILQEQRIAKVFFDVRNDADALFAHYGVALQGVYDIQLMENATRQTTQSRKYLNGLKRCVDDYVIYGKKETLKWKLIKEQGEKLFKQQLGGSYEVFNQRPMPEKIRSYCVGDVQFLPELWDRFWIKSTPKWQDLVKAKTAERVALSERSEYQPQGPNRTLAPWNMEQNKTLDEWNYVPTLEDYFEELHMRQFEDMEEDFFPADDYDDWDNDAGDFQDFIWAQNQGPPS